MTISTPTGFSPNSVARAASNAARFVIGSRVRLLAVAVAVLGLGLTLNWSWLVAAGLAPVILALAPCAAMCALGLCMAGGSSEKQPSSPSAASGPDPGLTSPLQLAALSEGSEDAPTAAGHPADALMTISTPTGTSPNSMARAATNAARFIIGSRVRLVVLAVAVLGLGLTFNWGWLVAAGIAPVILSLAPCAIMCALGLCMAGMAGRSSGKQPLTPSATSKPDPELTSPQELIASSGGSVDPPTAVGQPVGATEFADTEPCCSPRQERTSHV